MSRNDAELSAEDSRLFDAVDRNDTDAVQRALQDGANVNAVRRDTFKGSFYSDTTPLFEACKRGFDEIIRILLDAGADARWKDDRGVSAVLMACFHGHLSTVQLLINHDNGLVEMTDNSGFTLLFRAIFHDHSDIVRFLLDSGVDANYVDLHRSTALMTACRCGRLEIVRLLLAAGADVETRDDSQRTALHHAARLGGIGIMLELIRQHNANMFAVDIDRRTPFDAAYHYYNSRSIPDAAVDHLLEIYGNKLAQDHGQLALHELLKVVKYWKGRFLVPLGELTWKHLRTLLHSLDPELIRSRDDTGKLPIHIACLTNAPVEVLALILELDPTALRIADSTGALPIHLLCGTTAATEYTSVRYLVEQGGVGTLAARNWR